MFYLSPWNFHILSAFWGLRVYPSIFLDSICLSITVHILSFALPPTHLTNLCLLDHSVELRPAPSSRPQGRTRSASSSSSSSSSSTTKSALRRKVEAMKKDNGLGS